MNDLDTLARALRARQVSSRELTQTALTRIARLNRRLNAFLTVTAEQALEASAAADRELARGIDRGFLHGIPIAHKDLIRTRGVRTTAGSIILEHYIPKSDAAVVTRMVEAGAIWVGKTGLHELAYGITSVNPHFGAIRNPWDTSRIAGGSSGGSAVAVAAGMVAMATGTDTGGSIRVPASFCGVVGLKPTFGRVSAKGVLPLGVTQDHVGPIARTVRDAAIAFQTMAKDGSGYIPPRGIDLNGIRIGWPRRFFSEYVDPEVLAAVRHSLHNAVLAGAEAIEVNIPDMEALRWAAVTTLLSEAAVALKRFLPRKSEMGEDIQGYLEKGLAIPAVEYLEAQRVRGQIRRQFSELFQSVDCLLTPTTPMAAPKIGQKEVAFAGLKQETRAAATRFTRGMNAVGFPAISIPCGLTQQNLPIGLQIIAAANQEDKMLYIAAAIEDSLGFSGHKLNLET